LISKQYKIGRFLKNRDILLSMKTLISTQIPTEFGNFKLWVQNGERGREAVALSSIDLNPKHKILLRIHSECLTGDSFSSLACDCGQQKNGS